MTHRSSEQDVYPHLTHDTRHRDQGGIRYGCVQYCESYDLNADPCGVILRNPEYSINQTTQEY